MLNRCLLRDCEIYANLRLELYWQVVTSVTGLRGLGGLWAAHRGNGIILNWGSHDIMEISALYDTQLTRCIDFLTAELRIRYQPSNLRKLNINN